MKRAVKIILIALFSLLGSVVVSAVFIFFDLRGVISELKALKISINNSTEIPSGILPDLKTKLRRIEAFGSDPLIKIFSKKVFGNTDEDFKLARNLIEISPELSGAKTPKKYLLVFQNPAEARGTGGIIGAYAEIQVFKGKITLLKSGSNLDLQSLDNIPVSMPRDYLNLYGEDPAIWQNSNISPHFPYASRIWSALWENQFKEKLDGIIATDPIALSKVLTVIGTVKLESGETISSHNVVEKTLSTAYQRFENNNLARKNYLVQILNSVVNKLLLGNYSKAKMALALREIMHENRLQISLLDPKISDQIQFTQVGGALNYKSKNEFRAVLINTSGNKLDYYLTKSITISKDSCSKNSTTVFSVTVRNNLVSAAQLSDYVKGRLDLKLVHGKEGSHGFALMLYGPKDSEITSAIRSNTFAEDPSISTELNRPIAIFRTDLAKMSSETFSARFRGGVGPIVYKEQPLVNKDRVSIISKCK